MNSQEAATEPPRFVVYKNGEDLKELLQDVNNATRVSGEILFFQSLIKTLEMLGYSVELCEDAKQLERRIEAGRKNYYIMDYKTIRECSNMLSNVQSSVFCMCY